MVRAASLLHQQDAPKERRDRVALFFESRPKGDFTSFALFLLGRIDRAALFTEVKDLNSVSNVSWILGITSAHEGRYDEANAWFQVCLEPGLDIPPCQWVSQTLARWAQERCDVKQLARNGIF